MDRAKGLAHTNERRLLLAVIGTLTAALGAATVLLALLGLRHPVGATGGTGTQTDLGVLLVDLIWAGALLVVVGGGTAVGLVRAQQRRRPAAPVVRMWG